MRFFVRVFFGKIKNRSTPNPVRSPEQNSLIFPLRQIVYGEPNKIGQFLCHTRTVRTQNRVSFVVYVHKADSILCTYTKLTRICVRPN